MLDTKEKRKKDRGKGERERERDSFLVKVYDKREMPELLTNLIPTSRPSMEDLHLCTLLVVRICHSAVLLFDLCYLFVFKMFAQFTRELNLIASVFAKRA